MAVAADVIHKDHGLGKCTMAGCREYAIVGLNGHGVCLKHFEAGLAAIKQDVEARLTALAGETRGGV